MAETPTRRSKRFQPLVAHIHPTAWSSRDTSTFWTSQPCHTRPSIPDDYEALREDESSWTPTQGMCTAFYTSFARLKPMTKPGSRRAVESKANSKRKSNVTAHGEKEVFNVGDTVCIETGLMSGGNSVAVIVAMWELTTAADENTDEQSGPLIFVRVHWFERPSELPRVRPKREHYEVRTYNRYTVCIYSIILLSRSPRTKCIIHSMHRPSSPHPKSSIYVQCLLRSRGLNKPLCSPRPDLVNGYFLLPRRILQHFIAVLRWSREKVYITNSIGKRIGRVRLSILSRIRSVETIGKSLHKFYREGKSVPLRQNDADSDGHLRKKYSHRQRAMQAQSTTTPHKAMTKIPQMTYPL